jgi:hypothetical protein
MEKINKVVEYLISLGFQVEPCKVPLNRWETIKRDYLCRKSVMKWRHITDKISDFILKRFPIRYKTERPEKSVWLSLKQNDRTIIDVELKPKSRVHSVDFMTFEYSNFDFNIWRVNTFIDSDFPIEEFNLYFENHTWEEAIEEIEYNFASNPILKEMIRDKKLTELLDGK